MKRLDYSADDLEALLVLAYKRLEEHQLVIMNDPIHEWYMAYNADIRDSTAQEALAAFAKLSGAERTKIIAYFEATGKLPIKPKAAPPALIGSKPIVKNPPLVRKQHRKHSY